MKEASPSPALSWVVLFGALSRTPHGVMDLASPALAALLCLGTVPSFPLIALGMLTAFAGYTAVYALNDIMDCRADRERIRRGGFRDTEMAVEGRFIRHPVARDALSLGDGLTWVGLWAAAALVGAWLLNPVCAAIFVAGAALEAVYCLLLKVSHWRTLVHGVVKTCGALAAVFAVDPTPPPVYVLTLFLWLFFWEIGGQNIPADWHDLEEDKLLKARTMPLVLGLEKSGRAILAGLGISVVLGFVLGLTSPGRPRPASFAALFAAGLFLLLAPAWRLYRSQKRREAGALFSRASFYPLAAFVIMAVDFIAR
ncbi:MAG: UbiA family prenyltransferase [Pseudomonadota bacterium]